MKTPFGGSGRERSVGLSLQSDRISAAEIRLSKGRAVVVKAASEELPSGVITDGWITDPAAFAKAIKRLWRAGRFTTKKVSIAVREAQVLTREAELPWMEPPDFAAALPYQVQDFLPVDTATVEVGFHVTDTLAADPAAGYAEARNRVVLVAANSDALAEHALALAKAGLQPVRADSSAFALIRAVAGGRTSRSGDSQLVVDLGMDHTTLVIERDGQPLLIRAIASIGFEVAKELISHVLDDPTQVSTLAFRTGLNVPLEETAPIAQSSIFATSLVNPSTPKSEIDRAVETALSTWAGRVVAELRGTWQYAAETGKGAEHIVLTGVGSRVSGLADRFTSELGVPCTVFDPSRSFAAKTAAGKLFLEQAGSAEALGLARGVST